jgi:tetratricopeptide (TPR) repeat protein
VALLRRGLALVPALSDGDRRHEREFDLQIGLGQALSASRGWGVSEVGEAYTRARQLSVALNRPRAQLLALHGQSAYHALPVDLNQARQLLAEMRRLGEDTGDFAAQVLSREMGGYISIHLGEFTAAREDLEQGLALFDPADRPFYAELLAFDPLVALLAHSAVCLVRLGHLDQALVRRDAALAEARRLSHRHSLAMALMHAWVTDWSIGSEPGSLLPSADELLALTTEHGFASYQAVALVERGWCLAALGRADEGIALLGRGLAGLRESGFMDAGLWALRHLADACRMAGQLQAALDRVAEARHPAEAERCFQAERLRLTGDVMLAMDDPTAAEANYHEAIAVAQQQSAKLWELCAAVSLARLWSSQGKRAEARDLLAPVYNWFTEGFDTPVLHEAKALLRDLDCVGSRLRS